MPTEKPMLASKAELTKLTPDDFPLLASPKLDGIRALVKEARAVSRTFKAIPNLYVQSQIPGLPEKIDGELVVGDPAAKDAFRKTSSGVMSINGKPDFTYWVFDIYDHPEMPFHKRLDRLEEIVQLSNDLGWDFIKIVPHIEINSQRELLAYEVACLDQGYEGIMIRKPDGPYKFGRSTPKQGWLSKIKRFEDSEAIILECVELMHNDNVQTKNEVGSSVRSNHKYNMRASGVLGALKVKDYHTGVEFDIGSGFNAKQRKQFWEDRHRMPNLIVKYKFFPTGSKDKPRFPTFHGFRDPIDI